MQMNNQKTAQIIRYWKIVCFNLPYKQECTQEKIKQKTKYSTGT